MTISKTAQIRDSPREKKTICYLAECTHWLYRQNLLQRDSFYMISNTRSMKLISYCRKAHRVRRCEESVSVLEP